MTSFRALFRYHGYRKISFLSECLLTRLNFYVAPSEHFIYFFLLSDYLPYIALHASDFKSRNKLA